MPTETQLPIPSRPTGNSGEATIYFMGEFNTTKRAARDKVVSIVVAVYIGTVTARGAGGKSRYKMLAASDNEAGASVSAPLENEAITTFENGATRTERMGDLIAGLGVD